MSLIPKPQFPNVPSLPGVPQLLRSPIFPAAPPPIVGLALAGARLFQSLFTQPQWAIYKHLKPTQDDAKPGQLASVVVVAKRTPVVSPDSFLEFGYRNESTLSDYPVQDGGFSTYDKVANPFEMSLRMSKGGSKLERKKFLDSIDAIVGTLDLYDIFTPEKTYLSVNVLRFDISRRGNKAAFFFAEVDLYFREVREVTATYSSNALVTANAQNFSARPVQNAGLRQVKTTDLTPASVDIPSGNA